MVEASVQNIDVSPWFIANLRYLRSAVIVGLIGVQFFTPFQQLKADEAGPSSSSDAPVHMVSIHKDWETAGLYLDQLIVEAEKPADKAKLQMLKKLWIGRFLEYQKQEQEKLSATNDPSLKKKLNLEMSLTAIICVVTVAISAAGEAHVFVDAYRGVPEVTWNNIAAATSMIIFSGGYEGGIQAKVKQYSQWLFDRHYNPVTSLAKDKAEPADRMFRAEADIFAKRLIASVPFTVLFKAGQIGSGSIALESASDPVGILGLGLYEGGRYVLSTHAFWSYAKWIQSVDRIPERSRELRAHFVNFGLTNVANAVFLLSAIYGHDSLVGRSANNISIAMLFGGVAFFAASWATEKFYYQRNANKNRIDLDKDVSESKTTPKNPCGGVFL